MPYAAVLQSSPSPTPHRSKSHLLTRPVAEISGRILFLSQLGKFRRELSAAQI